MREYYDENQLFVSRENYSRSLSTQMPVTKNKLQHSILSYTLNRYDNCYILHIQPESGPIGHRGKKHFS